MPNSIIDQLPKIVKEGKEEAEKILERLGEPNKISLQTNELVLPSKDKTGLFRGKVPELPHTEQLPLDKTQLELGSSGGFSLASEQGSLTENVSYGEWINRLIYGDNLLVMEALLAGDEISGLPSMRGKIDLIYIDPPFDSKADYRTKITLPNGSIEQKPTVIEQFAYSDTWKDGTISYLKMLYPRLELMKHLLTNNGTIYIQIDWHVGHYVKVLMDEIFNKENFINEIVWKRTFSHGDVGQGAKHLGRLHDIIFIYSKSSNFILNQVYTPYSKEYIEKHFKHNDSDGRKYQSVSLTAPGGASKGNPYYEFLGVKRYWQYSKSNMEKLLNEGKIIQTKPGNVPRKKMYLDESKGIPLQDIWLDVAPIQGQAIENLNYATQKPLELIERIVKLGSNNDSIIADFFAGSGTTGAVAEKLGRKWIMSDIGKPATMVMRKRLIDQDSKPFFYQSIGDYQKEQYTKSEFRTIRSLAHVVLQLYGAMPFNEEQAPGNVGFIKQSQTLVYVDSPNKITGYNTIKKAQELRASFMGGWKKVIVLGWNFDVGIGQVISGLKDENLEVLVIPPDLLDRLKTKASYKQLISTGKIRFSSLQYLTIKPIKVKTGKDNKQTITIKLDNYVLLSPDSLPLNEDDRKKLQKIFAEDPLSLIEYWSIDPDYDGEVFRSRWQDYRGNVSNDEDPLRVVREAELEVIKKTNRKICIKAVDVFGFESMVVEEVN